MQFLFSFAAGYPLFTEIYDLVCCAIIFLPYFCASNQRYRNSHAATHIDIYIDGPLRGAVIPVVLRFP